MDQSHVVDAQQVPPGVHAGCADQGGRRHRGEGAERRQQTQPRGPVVGEQIPDPQLALRSVATTAVPRGVAGDPAGRGLGHGDAADTGQEGLLIGTEARPASGQRPVVRDRPPVVDGADRGRVAGAGPPDRGTVAGHDEVAGRHPEVVERGDRLVAQRPVDPGRRREQGRQQRSALGRLVQRPAEQRGEQTPPAVFGGDGHRGDAGRRHGRAADHRGHVPFDEQSGQPVGGVDAPAPTAGSARRVAAMSPLQVDMTRRSA